jgi:hypothetical protein
MPCRHKDVHVFGNLRTCLSCGETLFELERSPEPDLAASDSLPYEYRPLRYELGHEIRLIALYPSDDDENLKCDIFHANLLDKPVYEALSYTWADASGDSSFSQTLLCKGRTISITKNCDAALRCLRPKHRSRVLWVDSICIHQDDPLEKNHQVKLMSNIYSRASQVVAFLGVKSTDMSVGLHSLIDTLQAISPIEPVTVDKEEGVRELLALPYFHRVWIIQEIGLAQLVSLVVGSRTVHWTALTASMLLQLCGLLRINVPAALQWTPARRPEEELDLLAVLSKSRNCVATDARDKVFALLGLVHPHIAGQITVDYSVTKMQLYTDVATYCMGALSRFDVLQHVLAPQRNSDLVPSWVPQWDQVPKRTHTPIRAQFLKGHRDSLNTSWFMRQESRLERCSSRVTWVEGVQGFITRYTANAEKTSNIGVSTASYRQYIKLWSDARQEQYSVPTAVDLEVLAHHLTYNENSEFHWLVGHRAAREFPKRHQATQETPQLMIPFLKIRAHYLDTISCFQPGYLKVSKALPAWHGTATACATCCQDLGIASAQPVRSIKRKRLDPTIREQHQQYWRSPGYRHSWYRFEGEQSMGFAQAKPRIGDTIWALAGGEVPFILRQIGDHYTMIGECYLYRAAMPLQCRLCGRNVQPWPMQTEIIDIW